MNQHKLFGELQSIRDKDETNDIMGVTITFVKTVRGYGFGTEKTIMLHLNANGSYIFDLYEREGWVETEAESDSGEEQKDVVRHCGVWDYEGDEIIMDGFGFTDLYDQHEYTREGRDMDKLNEDHHFNRDMDKFNEDHHLSTRLAIRRPVPAKQPKKKQDYKRRRDEKSTLSVVVYF